MPEYLEGWGTKLGKFRFGATPPYNTLSQSSIKMTALSVLGGLAGGGGAWLQQRLPRRPAVVAPRHSLHHTWPWPGRPTSPQPGPPAMPRPWAATPCVT